MSTHFSAPTGRQPSSGRILGLLLNLSNLAIATQAGAAGAMPEQERLTAALRQLDGIERLVEQQATQPSQERTRFYFDYPRLRADLARVRAGIRDYLSPSRAQPRDLAPLLGDYRQNTAAPSDTKVVP